MTGQDVQSAPAPVRQQDVVAMCRNCGESLVLDSIWGAIHADGAYLCRHPTTGEPLCFPAQPAE